MGDARGVPPGRRGRRIRRIAPLLRHALLDLLHRLLHVLGLDAVGQRLPGRAAGEGLAQLLAELARVLLALLGIFGQRPLQHLVHRLGHLDAPGQLHHLAALVLHPREHLQHDDRQGVDVGPHVVVLLGADLGRHVLDGVPGAALGSDIGLHREGVGQGEVRDLEQIGQDDDVLRLHAAVDDLPGGVAERLTQLAADRLHLGQREGLVLAAAQVDDLAQGQPLEELHHIEAAVPVPVHVQVLDHVLVDQVPHPRQRGEEVFA